MPVLRLEDALSKDHGNLFADLTRVILEKDEDKFSYQHARYDGDLKGTDVGMVLFYTDLLAKLWAIDYAGSTPNSEIAEFQPLTRTLVSAMYKEEVETLRDTRLWFGPQQRGFQIAAETPISCSPTTPRACTPRRQVLSSLGVK